MTTSVGQKPWKLRNSKLPLLDKRRLQPARVGMSPARVGMLSDACIGRSEVNTSTMTRGSLSRYPPRPQKPEWGARVWQLGRGRVQDNGPTGRLHVRLSEYWKCVVARKRNFVSRRVERYRNNQPSSQAIFDSTKDTQHTAFAMGRQVELHLGNSDLGNDLPEPPVNRCRRFRPKGAWREEARFGIVMAGDPLNPGELWME